MQVNKKAAVVMVAALALTVSAGEISNAASTTKKTTKKTAAAKPSITKPAGLGQNGEREDHDGFRGGPGATLNSVLANLVKKGTLTQAQADAVKNDYNAAEELEHANRPAPKATSAK